MFDQLLARAEVAAEARRKARIEQLASEVPPPGVTITRNDEGIVLSGKRLRRRLITDAALRSFGR